MLFADADGGVSISYGLKTKIQQALNQDLMLERLAQKKENYL